MFVARKELLLFAVLSACGLIAGQTDFASTYCLLSGNRVNLGNINDKCQTYYTCSNGKATLNSCPSGLLYDKNLQKCTSTGSNICQEDGNPCSGLTGVFAPGQNCGEWYYCQNGKIGRVGNCPPNQYLSGQECIYGKCPDTGVPSLSSPCQIMPNGVYFGSTSSCDAWNKCSPGSNQPSTGLCSSNNDKPTAGLEYLFNPVNGICDLSSNVKCGSPEQPTEPECNTDNKGVTIPDAVDCSSSWTCDGTTWVKSTCTSGVYDTNSGKCLPVSQALTSNTCNRCAHVSGSGFIYGVDPTCKTYWYCNNGQGTSATCPSGKIFNGVGCTSQGTPTSVACTACSDYPTTYTNPECTQIDTNCADADNVCTCNGLTCKLSTGTACANPCIGATSTSSEITCLADDATAICSSTSAPPPPPPYLCTCTDAETPSCQDLSKETCECTGVTATELCCTENNGAATACPETS